MSTSRRSAFILALLIPLLFDQPNRACAEEMTEVEDTATSSSSLKKKEAALGTPYGTRTEFTSQLGNEDLEIGKAIQKMTRQKKTPFKISKRVSKIQKKYRKKSEEQLNQIRKLDRIQSLKETAALAKKEELAEKTSLAQARSNYAAAYQMLKNQVKEEIKSPQVSLLRKKILKIHFIKIPTQGIWNQNTLIKPFASFHNDVKNHLRSSNYYYSQVEKAVGELRLLGHLPSGKINWDNLNVSDASLTEMIRHLIVALSDAEFTKTGTDAPSNFQRDSQSHGEYLGQYHGNYKATKQDALALLDSYSGSKRNKNLTKFIQNTGKGLLTAGKYVGVGLSGIIAAPIAIPAGLVYGLGKYVLLPGFQEASEATQKLIKSHKIKSVQRAREIESKRARRKSLKAALDQLKNSVEHEINMSDTTPLRKSVLKHLLEQTMQSSDSLEDIADFDQQVALCETQSGAKYAELETAIDRMQANISETRLQDITDLQSLLLNARDYRKAKNHVLAPTAGLPDFNYHGDYKRTEGRTRETLAQYDRFKKNEAYSNFKSTVQSFAQSSVAATVKTTGQILTAPYYGAKALAKQTKQALHRFNLYQEQNRERQILAVRLGATVDPKTEKPKKFQINKFQKKWRHLADPNIDSLSEEVYNKYISKLLKEDLEGIKNLDTLQKEASGLTELFLRKTPELRLKLREVIEVNAELKRAGKKSSDVEVLSNSLYKGLVKVKLQRVFLAPYAYNFNPHHLDEMDDRVREFLEAKDRLKEQKEQRAIDLANRKAENREARRHAKETADKEAFWGTQVNQLARAERKLIDIDLKIEKLLNPRIPVDLKQKTSKNSGPPEMTPEELDLTFDHEARADYCDFIEAQKRLAFDSNSEDYPSDSLIPYKHKTSHTVDGEQSRKTFMANYACLPLAPNLETLDKVENCLICFEPVNYDFKALSEFCDVAPEDDRLIQVPGDEEAHRLTSCGHLIHQACLKGLQINRGLPLYKCPKCQAKIPYRELDADELREKHGFCLDYK